MYDGEIQMWIC